MVYLQSERCLICTQRTLNEFIYLANLFTGKRTSHSSEYSCTKDLAPASMSENVTFCNRNNWIEIRTLKYVLNILIKKGMQREQCIFYEPLIHRLRSPL